MRINTDVVFIMSLSHKPVSVTPESETNEMKRSKLFNFSVKLNVPGL